MNYSKVVYTQNGSNGNGSRFKFYRNIAIICLIFVLIAIFLSNCMPNAKNYPVDDPAGFLSGIWHGWIAPLSLVYSFFGDSGIYAVNNTGFPYDFGFYMAIVSGFGGLSFSRKKFKRHIYTSTSSQGYRDPNVVYEYNDEI